MVADYTWSKLLTDADSSEPWIAGVVGSGVGAGSAQDQYNRRLEKSYGVLDLPHMFKFTGAYDLPFGPKRKFFSNGITSHVLGNWSVSAFIYGQSGYPLGVVDTAYSNFLQAGTPRPPVRASPPCAFGRGVPPAGSSSKPNPPRPVDNRSGRR